MRRAILGTALVAGLLAVALPAQAGHLDWYPVAQWEMNEGAKQTTLRDLSGNHFAGHIGRHVTPTGTYHRFPRVPRDEVHPANVDRVPDYPGLDPGYGDFAVVVRFLWPNDRHDMNLVQKGQGSPAGGLVKVKTSVPAAGQPEGQVKCLFRGSIGDSQVESYGHRKLNDGKWHVVRCERTNSGTAMFIDGQLVDTNDNQPGLISNDWPVAIGGNTVCEDTPTENNVCNYWAGRIGFVRWIKR